MVKAHVQELRDILDDENKIGKLRLLNVDWRLSLVTACRQKQKLMVPKYTMQIQVNELLKNEEEKSSNMVFDLDYTMMKRL